MAALNTVVMTTRASARPASAVARGRSTPARVSAKAGNKTRPTLNQMNLLLHLPPPPSYSSSSASSSSATSSSSSCFCSACLCVNLYREGSRSDLASSACCQLPSCEAPAAARAVPTPRAAVYREQTAIRRRSVVSKASADKGASAGYTVEAKEEEAAPAADDGDFKVVENLGWKWAPEVGPGGDCLQCPPLIRHTRIGSH